MLDRQEELVQAKRWREHGDHDAANKLVTSHLRLVPKIAREYCRSSPPISEAISAGNVGLMQSVARFQPEKGFRFGTYAAWWIRASIQEYILRSWSLVKMATTANHKKLARRLQTPYHENKNAECQKTKHEWCCPYLCRLSTTDEKQEKK